MSHPTLDEIVSELRSRCEDVARAYAPGGHVDGGRYWALDPGRDDRKIGSFYVNLRGAYRGRFRDESTGEGGDMLDLIQRATRKGKHEAIEEAKRFLGMVSETPEMRKARLDRARKAEKAREAEERELAEERARRQRQAHATWLEAEPMLLDTPVEWYLRARAIDLRALPRLPGALRYHPKLRYYAVDDETGEVVQGEFPAMVAAIYGGWSPDGARPPFLGVHKTYLARRPDGSWGKAPVPKPKLLWGSKKGGYIRVWPGLGPKGGKGPSIARAARGSWLYVAEGIEDALSAVVLPGGLERRVAAAIDLGNIREMRLPPAISEVVLIADNDPKPEQREALDRAVRVFAEEGRHVRVWRNEYGGKDLNDALVLAMRAEAEKQKEKAS